MPCSELIVADMGKAMFVKDGVLEKSLAGGSLSEMPFRHVVFDQVFSPETAASLVGLLDGVDEWRVRLNAFYKFSDIEEITSVVEGHEGVEWVASPATLEALASYLGRLFKKTFCRKRALVAAHRMTAGDFIGPHNDEPGLDRRTHRFIVNLISETDSPSGGDLVLLGASEPREECVVVAPRHNSGIALEFSEFSFHEVRRVDRGTRYSLIYNFWAFK